MTPYISDFACIEVNKEKNAFLMEQNLLHYYNYTSKLYIILSIKIVGFATFS